MNIFKIRHNGRDVFENYRSLSHARGVITQRMKSASWYHVTNNPEDFVVVEYELRPVEVHPYQKESK